jgi:hypothetical protein
LDGLLFFQAQKDKGMGLRPCNTTRMRRGAGDGVVVIILLKRVRGRGERLGTKP